MSNKTQVGDWSFEIVQIRARKTPKYGEPYTAIANVTIVNGVAHIEGLLSVDGVSIKDVRSIKKYLKDLGFDKYVHVRKPV